MPGGSADPVRRIAAVVAVVSMLVWIWLAARERRGLESPAARAARHIAAVVVVVAGTVAVLRRW